MPQPKVSIEYDEYEKLLRKAEQRDLMIQAIYFEVPRQMIGDMFMTKEEKEYFDWH